MRGQVEQTIDICTYCTGQDPHTPHGAPENIKIITKEQSKILHEFRQITQIFKNKETKQYLTVSEIHDAFDGMNTKKPSKKTLYRWLDKLKDAGVIIETGKRYCGRIAENLYCLAAELIFIEDEPQEKRFWNQKQYANHLNTLVSSHLKEFGIDITFPDEIMKQFVQVFFDKHDEIVDEIVLQAKRDGPVMDTYRDIKKGKNNINQINSFAAILSIILREPEVFKPLQEYMNNK